MATYSVRPLPDGADMRGNWQVERGGSQISTHTTKSGAKRRAREEAGAEDTVVIHRTDGTIQERLPGNRRRRSGGRKKGMGLDLGLGSMETVPDAGFVDGADRRESDRQVGKLDDLVLDEPQERKSLESLDVDFGLDEDDISL